MRGGECGSHREFTIMKLASQDSIASLDADFGAMAVKRGRYAWGLPQLSMREKAFVFVAADLCCRALQFPLQTHVMMALSNGVKLEDIREVVRHLAPYVGYPTAAETLMRLIEIEKAAGEAGLATNDENSGTPQGQPQEARLPDGAVQQLKALDEDFAAFVQEQFEERWGRPNLTVAERALATIATDVLNGTLDQSFAQHVGLALDNGAAEEKVRAVLLLVAEFGMAKTGRAFAALADVLAARR
ncbi:carboxymuconolactone decarboxylase family protein [Nonomuraea sp. NPDC050202]|uniref:carboxymuconolactone decarboxylase family protein n=1 Tax=Nonomuraea sp. NPDC050202 TaxID=3155035 RepID=UPI0033CD2F83